MSSQVKYSKAIICGIVKIIVKRWTKCLLLLSAVCTYFVLGNVINLNSSPISLYPDLAGEEKHLFHFRRNRYLKHYLNNAKLLLAPLRVHDKFQNKTPLVVMVASAPSRIAYRNAIRKTWGPYFATFFVMGITQDANNSMLYQNESQYEDLIVYDFKDHYMNMTIKTALMMKWTLESCPEARFFFKCDDDIIINPWMMNKILEEIGNKDMLLGNVRRNVPLKRDRHKRWYLPHWLCREDIIPEYLGGGGYLITRGYLRLIYATAGYVPMHNIEDIYFTYHVAVKTLELNLTHEERLSNFRMQPTWFPFPACAYWIYATLHQFKPYEILKYWQKYLSLSERYSQGELVCAYYKTHLKPYVKMFARE